MNKKQNLQVMLGIEAYNSAILTQSFIDFSEIALYNSKAVYVMTVESRAISWCESCQDRKVAAVSAFWDVLRGCSAGAYTVLIDMRGRCH